MPLVLHILRNIMSKKVDITEIPLKCHILEHLLF